MNNEREFSGKKYHRPIVGLLGRMAVVDVYRVLDAFNVTDPGLQHAIKKLLCAGIRGKGDSIQDKEEAIDAIKASILLEKQKIAINEPPQHVRAPSEIEEDELPVSVATSVNVEEEELDEWDKPPLVRIKTEPNHGEPVLIDNNDG